MTRNGPGSGSMIRALMIAWICCGTGVAWGQAHPHGQDTLGVVDFPISGTPSSQRAFRDAMILLHHMTYPQARAKFREIAVRDSQCAMAYWGVAMTLFQPLWPTRPGLADLQQGWEASRRATELQPPTKREQLLIRAVAGFFRDPRGREYWDRIREWATEMKACYDVFPDDHEVAALYALSLLATIPPDEVTSPNNARAAEILLRIMKENPRHPGAMHYLIHANDAPGRERESLDVLREYETIAPHNPHALHMPTHIYTRLGDWPAVIRGNIKAALAALDFPAGEHGEFIWDEYPHAIEYLLYAYLQQGDDEAAAIQLKRLQGTERLEPTFKTAFHYSSTRARFALERNAWSEAAAIVPTDPATVRWERFPWPESIGWFARGLGSLHTGKSAEVVRAIGRLEELEQAAARANEELFKRNIRVLRLELTAWSLFAEGRKDSSVAVLREAVRLETSTPKHAVTPGGTLPAYELLGDLLLECGEPSAAYDAYQRSLAMYPGRFNSLLGAARSARATGNAASAAGLYRRLLATADNRSTREGVLEAKAYEPN